MTDRGGASLRDFLAVSAALTGFSAAELAGTAMGPIYWAHLVDILGERLAARWLSVGRDAVHRAGVDVAGELDRRLLTDADLGPPARGLILLWYTGQWTQLPGSWRQRHGASPADVDAVLSADAYTEGLVWKAIGAHPQGAKAPGFATWVAPPATGAGLARS